MHDDAGGTNGDHPPDEEYVTAVEYAADKKAIELRDAKIFETVFATRREVGEARDELKAARKQQANDMFAVKQELTNLNLSVSRIVTQAESEALKKIHELTQHNAALQQTLAQRATEWIARWKRGEEVTGVHELIQFDQEKTELQRDIENERAKRESEHVKRVDAEKALAEYQKAERQKTRKVAETFHAFAIVSPYVAAAAVVIGVLWAAAKALGLIK
jgi:hypothetical protein